MNTKEWENVVIEQIKNSFRHRLTSDQFFIYEEIIEFIGYACSFKSPRKFTFGTMYPEDWQTVVDTITIGELADVLSVSYKYPNKTDEQRCFIVLGTIARIFYNRKNKHLTQKPEKKNKTQELQKQVLCLDIGNVNVQKPNKNSTSKKKSKKQTDDLYVIKVCFGEIDGCAIWGGASFFVNNNEKIRVLKKTYKNKNTTQYSVAIECIQAIVDRISNTYKRIALYDQSNLGFKSCNGKYGKVLLKIKKSFNSFKYMPSSSKTHELKTVLHDDLLEYAVDTFIMKEFFDDTIVETLLPCKNQEKLNNNDGTQCSSENLDLSCLSKSLTQAQKEALFSYAQGLAASNMFCEDDANKIG